MGTKDSGFQLYPVDSGRKTLVKAVMNIDPHFSATPYWIVNHCTKHGVAQFIPTLRSQMTPERRNKSEFAARLAKGSKAYDILKERLNMKDGNPSIRQLAEELEIRHDGEDEFSGFSISAGSCQDVEVPLRCAGDFVEWEYHLKCHKISFSVHFSPIQLNEYGEVIPAAAHAVPEQVIEPVHSADGKGDFAVPRQGVVL